MFSQDWYYLLGQIESLGLGQANGLISFCMGMLGESDEAEWVEADEGYSSCIMSKMPYKWPIKKETQEPSVVSLWNIW